MGGFKVGKKYKQYLVIILTVIILIFAGYYFRIDRFGLAQISWVDCVQVNGSKYYSNYERTEIDDMLINKKLGMVKFNVYENVHNGSYRFRNGDATFLEVGTEIYSVKGDVDSIAVKIGNSYYEYRSDLYE